MKTEHDIQKYLIRSSIIVYSLAFITVIAIFLAFKTVSNVEQESRKLVYMVQTDGEVIPLKLVEQKESLIIEMKSHLTIFVDNYYNLRENNIDAKLNKALWAGDFKLDFQNRQNNGAYATIKQYGVEHEAELKPENITLEQTGQDVNFSIIIDLNEKHTTQVRKFKIFAQGMLKSVDRNFPYNPHGLYIYNYREDKKIQIDE